MHRPIVIIVSDEEEFSLAITARWLVERNVPALSVEGSDSCSQLQKENFDLAIVGGFQPEMLGPGARLPARHRQTGNPRFAL